MKVGVIGGSGFIGSHLVDKLLEAGHNVTVFDIMRPHREDVRHVFLDLFDFHKVVVGLAGNYEAFYLLAAMANVDDIHKSPLEAAIVNFQGVVNVLEAIRRYGGRLIFASTVWVYMLAEEEIVDENTPLLVQNVNHTYTASKTAAELYIQSYNKLYGVDFTILRYGIPYGPRGRAGTVIANFINRALKGEPLVIYGDGNQYRNFIYVEDLAHGNVAALKEVARNQTYNLEGLRPVSIKEIAETVESVVGNVKIEYKEARPGDYKAKIVSAEKAKEELGWEPKVDLEEGIRRYTEWYIRYVRKYRTVDYEMRKFPRYQIRKPLRYRRINYKGPLEEPFKYTFTKNISEGGILFECSSPIDVDAELELYLKSTTLDKERRIIGKVVRLQQVNNPDDNRKKYDIGVRFFNTTEEEKLRLF